MKTALSRPLFDFRLLLICLTIAPLCVASAGDRPEKGGKPLEKVLTNDRYQAFLINNVFNYYQNNGSGSFNGYSANNEGFEFPKGSGKATTFQDGILWGGYHKGRAIPKAGGSMYRQALQAGKILSSGTATANPVADDPALPRYRIYRVRPHVNPSTPFDPAMEAVIQEEEVTFLKRYVAATARAIYDQYIIDWMEWPAGDGAPFRDIDGNGAYSPLSDIPGIPGADQTLWYVANDLDSARVDRLSGSPPIGLEMQKTIWGYRRARDLGNTIFVSTKLINRSGARIDSMLIGCFGDPDLGDAGDDFSACDTTRDMSYVYNAGNNDGTYGPAVPAVGFVLLQGPLVQGGPADTGWIGTRARAGYRNLRASAAIMISGGQIEYADPVQGQGGDAQIYCMLKGRTRTCASHIDPTTGSPTTFLFSGDPAAGTGWNENTVSLFPGDRRILLSTGPFTFGAGDTQEVVIAHLVAQGGNRLSSITSLRRATDSVRAMFRGLPSFSAPDFRWTLTNGPPQNVALHMTADARGTSVRSVTVSLRRPGGAEAVHLELSDDGMHSDGGSGDRIFGGGITFAQEQDPFSVVVHVVDGQNVPHAFDGPFGPVTTAGPVIIGNPRIFSDNINGDGVANPGELLRYGIIARNVGALALSNLSVVAGADTHRIAALAPGSADSMTYRPADPGSYFSAWVPSGLTAPVFGILFEVNDDRGNKWNSTAALPVSSIPYLPTTTTVPRTAGQADGSFHILIVDPAQFRNHRYSIIGVDSIDSVAHHGITLIDSTDGRVLLRDHPLPGTFGFSMPVTEGFKIQGGSTLDHSGRAMAWQVLRGNPHLASYGSSDILGLEGPGGNVGNALEHWPSGGVPYERQHSLLITFASTDSTGVILNAADPEISYAYRYLENASLPAARPEFAPWIKNPAAGFAYQDFTRTLPFAVYDADVTPPRRLMAGYLENNVAGGTVDGRYWPPIASRRIDNSAATGPREWFFVFDVTYSESPDPSLQVDIWNTHLPLMWVGYPPVYGPFVEADQLKIRAGKAPGSGDRWSFTLNHDDFLPASTALAQNFPNPFNPETTIRYTLSLPSQVKLEVYNILGQHVRVLLDGSQYAGEFSVAWDGKNDEGRSVASGVYIYRLESSVLSAPASSFAESKKMLLLR